MKFIVPLFMCVVSVNADISGIWMMGQSLCDGSESLPVVSSEGSKWGKVMFDRGVRTWLAKDNVATPAKRVTDSCHLCPQPGQGTVLRVSTLRIGMGEPRYLGMQVSASCPG